MISTCNGLIDRPKHKNQILVFGSNREGRHGLGIALIAKKYWGAIGGRSIGLQGQSYAIITKDLNLRTHPSVSASEIISQIDTMYELARTMHEFEFIVPYTATGTNLNNYEPAHMAAMFGIQQPPANVIFEEGFAKLMINVLPK